MKRVLVTAVAALSLILGVAVAQAHGGPGGHDGWGGGDDHSSTPTVAVAGTVVSVDPSAGTFVANAFVPDDHGWGNGGWDPGHHYGSRMHGDQDSGSSDAAPATTQVTINTNGDTVFRVDGQTATISSLSPGQRFIALFNGSPGDSLQTIVSGDALAVYAHTAPAPRQLYAFVGKVTAVNTSSTPNTVTVDVTSSFPAGLVPAGSAPQTFTVSPDTMILGGSSSNGLQGGSLSDISVGDLVAGGEIGTAGETLSQVEASPLGMLIDFPSSSTSSGSGSSAGSQSAALHEALGLFGYHFTGKEKNKGKRYARGHHKHHKHHGNGKGHSKSHATRR